MTRNPLMLAWTSLALIMGLVVVGSFHANSTTLHTSMRPDDRAPEGGLQSRRNELGPAVSRALPARQIPGTVIAVNGQAVVSVANAQEAQMVLANLKEWYRSTALQGAQKVEQLGFNEAVTVQDASVAATGIHTVEEAMNILRLGTDKLVQHTVVSGDTLWDVATKYNIDVDRIAKSNPTVSPESLQVGQQLLITTKDPYIHFIGVQVLSQKEGIPFAEVVKEDGSLWPWQVKIEVQGIYGQKQVTYRISKQDNVETKREVLETKSLSQPVTQVRVQGTRQAPSLGTGRYFWPVLGPITSYFGPRWGTWHTGVDIGIPEGTPIKAADAGMVVAVGWDGGYGRTVKVDHGGGKIVTLYAHLSTYAVAVGDVVRKGEVVGYSGNTGHSTGPHLHFEIRVSGLAQNPLDFYPAQ